MPNEPLELSDAAKAEIARCVQIIKEDTLVWRAMGHSETSVSNPADKLEEPVENDPVVPPIADDSGPKSPPPKDISTPEPPKKKAGLYWGTEE